MQLWPGPIAAVITATSIFLLLRTGLASKVLDRPNDRSLHTTATPRIGGICLMISIVAVAPWCDARTLWPIIAAATALSLLSLADDIWGLPVAARFVFHFAAAAFVLVIFPPPSVLFFPFFLLTFVWMTNLYNFMDGIDGLAGGMAAFGFGAFAIVALLEGDLPLGMLSTAIAGAAVGFLAFNIHPAKVFMGDAGSIPLGFLAAALGYYGFIRGVWSWWFPVLIFSPFIVDATITLLRRLLSRRKIWQAHREHYFQRMARSKFGHTGTTAVWYTLMAGVAGTAIFLLRATATVTAMAMLAWLFLYALAMFWIDRRYGSASPGIGNT